MRPADLYEVVCQLSPIEMWYHLHFVPMQAGGRRRSDLYALRPVVINY